MTREEALAVLKTNYRCMTEEKNCPRTCEGCGLAMQPGELEEAIRVAIKTLEPKTGHCKDCKYFEYDSVAKVDGVPLIVAHEICSRWGDGCKTKEDGYCFLYEPQERSDKE